MFNSIKVAAGVDPTLWSLSRGNLLSTLCAEPGALKALLSTGARDCMSSKGRSHREEAWRNAKKICRLSRRQVEMARALGMNPKKLPGLRPSPQQRWKLPVGEFIEACYWKRFGHPLDPHPPESGLGSSELLIRQQQTLKSVQEANSQVEQLVCYFMNLTDDLEAWLAHGTVGSEVLAQLIRELREIAHALETGKPISPMPEIPQAPGPPRDGLLRDRPADFDDDIPF